MDMRTRIPINTTLDPSVVEELDKFLAEQPFKMTRAAFIEGAVKQVLAELKAKRAKDQGK